MDGGRSASEVRLALREATGPIHERLHGAAPFLALSQGRLSLQGYAALLRRLATYHFTVARHLRTDPDRLALLKSDLASVAAADPPSMTWRAPSTEAATLGWKYVVDGSIFGGHVIYRQLDYLFGGQESGRRFFRGAPAATRDWQMLCQEIERIGADPAPRDQMIAGARNAFAAFERLIETRELLHA